MVLWNSRMAGRRIYVRGIPYLIEVEIGYGLHSVVYAGRNLQDGQSVAIKKISFVHDPIDVKAKTSSHQQTFWKEIQMLLYLQPLNPFVIRILNYDYNNRYGIIIMERGETFRNTLMHYVLKDKLMPPSLVRKFWLQMVEAIYYMHRIGIVHGDCKPENFIQVGPHGNTLRLIDMGISFQLPPYVTSRILTAAGTPDYVSPEMINSRIGTSARSIYGYKADVWALGVILYEMTFGVRPLQGLGGNSTKIVFLGQIQNDIRIPDHPDKQLRDLLKRCLRVDPRRRPTIEQVLNHPYLTQAR